MRQVWKSRYRNIFFLRIYLLAHMFHRLKIYVIIIHIFFFIYTIAYYNLIITNQHCITGVIRNNNYHRLLAWQCMCMNIAELSHYCLLSRCDNSADAYRRWEAYVTFYHIFFNRATIKCDMHCARLHKEFIRQWWYSATSQAEDNTRDYFRVC